MFARVLFGLMCRRAGGSARAGRDRADNVSSLIFAVLIVMWLGITRAKGMRMATTNPLQFIQQTRAEVSKIVWPTRREVLLTTVMVFIMAALTAVFFALVDLLIRSGLQGLLTIFG